MDDPFFRGFNRYDQWAGAVLCEALIAGSPSGCQRVFDAIEPGAGFVIEGTITTPTVVGSVSPRYVFVAIQGTTTWAQWVLNVLASVQVAVPGIPGSVALSFGGLAATLWPAIRAKIAGRLAGRSLVLFGHSLGAAAVQCMLPLAEADGASPAICFCYGSPRVGNVVFASAVGSRVQRIETTNDPIVGVPPEVWAGHDSRFPIPGIPPVAFYTHAGTAQTIDAYGTLVDGGNGITFPEVVQAFSIWEAPTHDPDVYTSRLQTGLLLDPFPPEVGYADGSQIVSEERQLAAPPAPMRMVSMPYLTEATIFFRANNGVVEGWAESVYFQSDVPTVLALIQSTLVPNRTLSLSNQVEVHAVRAARADGIRFSLAKKLLSTVPGQLSLPVNEFGDCINFAIDSAGGARRIYNFRGIPDDWTAGQVLTPGGNAGVGIMSSYLTLLRNSGAALKIPFGGNPFLPIAIIANNPLAGGPIQVTTLTPSGVTHNTLVTIRGLRGYPYLRGQWRAESVDSLNFRLVGSQRYNINLAVNNGEVRVDEFVTDTMTSFAYSGIGFRKTGRPFGQPRGKGSKRLLRS